MTFARRMGLVTTARYHSASLSSDDSRALEAAPVKDHTARPPKAILARRRAPARPAIRTRRAGATATPRVFQSDDPFFRHIVVGLRNGVLAIRRDGSIAVINAEAYRLFQIQPDPRHIGRPAAEVLQRHPDVLRVLANAFELNHLPNRVELRLDATGTVIGYTLSRVVDETGQTVGVTFFFKDLTRVEQIEERERLRDRLAALGEMAAAIAHEVKNPLAGIEVLAGLLRRQLQDQQDVQSILTEIISEAKMANAIVLEVLEFVRPVRLQVEPTSLAEIVRNALMIAETKSARGEIAVRVEIPDELPGLQGDRHQLCQVFTNLFINAFEALDGRGALEISAALTSVEEDHPWSPDRHAIPMIVASVADDGPGVPAELSDRIFSPFFSTKPRGSGLGLAIVRKIVDAHDGRIDVESAPGRGTRFRVTLPVSSSHEWFR
jgi:signal transduction histidine kinase